MSGTTKIRRSLLDRMLGKKQEPGSVAETMAKLEATLDEQGVDRKELDETKMKGFLEKLVEQLKKPLSQITDDTEKVDVLANELAAAAIGSLLEAAADTPAEDDVEALVEGDEDIEPETEVMEDDEDEDPLPEQLMELSGKVKDLADESNENIKAMNELIPAVVKMAETFETLKPLTKEAGKIDALIARMEAIEKKQNLRPRAASSAKETVVKNDDLQAEIKKGAEGQKMILGMPVKE